MNRSSASSHHSDDDITSRDVVGEASLNDSAARDDVVAALKELDSVVQALIHQRDLTRAVHFSLRALDIRRRFFGLGHFSFEEARIQTSFLIVEAARVHQANDRFKETAELLAHVDRMTEHALPNAPELLSLDRSRRIARLAMMKELLVARYRQGRHRSALTFGRHVLELARDTMCLYELPSLHLNIASVHSVLGQHKEALRHCYLSFQKICLILESLEEPERYPFAELALSLESLDKDGVVQHAQSFEVFMKCCSLVGTEMGEEVDMDSVAPSFKAPSSADSHDHDTMEPERRRWGGTLALAFRNMAAEQEHLMMLDGALLTYKVAHTTALSCLGPQHPVSLQCEQALRDAEGAAKARAISSANVSNIMQKDKKSGSKERSHVDSFLHRGRATPEGSLRAGHRNERSGAATPVAGTKGGYGTANSSERKVVRRPAWNDLYNSDLPVPMHHEERMHPSHLSNANSRANSRQQQRSASAMSYIAAGYANSSAVDISAIPVDERSLHHNTSTASHSHRSLLPSRSASPLPPRPATTSFGDMSGLPTKYLKTASLNGKSVAGRPVTADDAIATGGANKARYPDDREEGAAAYQQRQYQQQLLEPISIEDFSFLQNTFKLRYDINFNRPNWRFGAGTTKAAKREKKELGILKEERRAADALAAELGIVS